MNDLCKNILLGIATADALGAPVEFESAEDINLHEVETNYSNHPNRLTGFGTWGKPVGTFTDDTSMSLCTAEFLVQGPPHTEHLMSLYAKWLNEGYWTADGEVFDVGHTTQTAISNFLKNGDSTTSGPNDIRSNGNGALMRILPILCFAQHADPYTMYNIAQKVTICTHGHEIAVECSFLYLEIANKILHHKYEDKTKYLAYFQDLIGLNSVAHLFSDTWEENYLNQPLEVNTQGYVAGSLEIAIHSFVSTNSYKEAVLKAIAYGGDTDTNAAITGGLAAIYYGANSIPTEWIAPLKRKDEIIALAKQVDLKYSQGENNQPTNCSCKQ